MASNMAMNGDEWKTSESGKENQETRDEQAKSDGQKGEPQAAKVILEMHNTKPMSYDEKITAITESTMDVVQQYRDFTAALIQQNKELIQENKGLTQENKELKAALSKSEQEIEGLRAEAISLRSAFSTELTSRLQPLTGASGGSSVDRYGSHDETDGSETDFGRLNSTRQEGEKVQSDSSESPDNELMTALAESLDAELMLAHGETGESSTQNAP